MKTSPIVAELREFFQAYPEVTASRLAKGAGMSQAFISFLIHGKRQDCTSVRAEALRSAMETIRKEQKGE